MVKQKANPPSLMEEYYRAFIELKAAQKALWDDAFDKMKISPDSVLILWAVRTYPRLSIPRLAEKLELDVRFIAGKVLLLRKFGEVKLLPPVKGSRGAQRPVVITRSGRKVLKQLSWALPPQ